ncbi:MAG: hypothetical protein HYX81_01730 [Chloroflexi bacterium]|nr:hypothetical protein [Chloroflexota bacterium]
METKKIIWGTIKVFLALLLTFSVAVVVLVASSTDEPEDPVVAASTDDGPQAPVVTATPISEAEDTTTAYYYDSFVAASNDDPPKDTTITYVYDPVKEEWIKTVSEVPLLQNPDGTYPKPINTLIIRIQQNNPIQEIMITEALVLGSDTIFEIAGHDASDSANTGVLRIGTLSFKKVDAEELDFDDTEAVNISMSNVIAKDNELDVDVDIVNVVAVGRGAPGSLFLGASRADLFRILDISAGLKTTLLPLNEKTVAPSQFGIRVDRIRILGPSNGSGHIERLTVQNTSVFGNIQVRNVKAQDIILQDVSLDDDLAP